LCDKPHALVRVGDVLPIEGHRAKLCDFFQSIVEVGDVTLRPNVGSGNECPVDLASSINVQVVLKSGKKFYTQFEETDTCDDSTFTDRRVLRLAQEDGTLVIVSGDRVNYFVVEAKKKLDNEAEKA
jgi:hypothetical protein